VQVSSATPGFPGRFYVSTTRSCMPNYDNSNKAIQFKEFP